MTKKRITIDISPEALKALSIAAIEQGTKVKLLIEKIVENKAKAVNKAKEAK